MRTTIPTPDASEASIADDSDQETNPLHTIEAIAPFRDGGRVHLIESWRYLKSPEGRDVMDRQTGGPETRHIAEEADLIAPDGSEIRLLVSTARGSAAHGLLPPGGVSKAVAHRTVEEIWYVVAGRAEVWRRFGSHQSTVAVSAGSALTIPTGTHFQFRTVGDESFAFIMCTMPPWPGADEASRVPDHWPVVRS
jgi:mannose-6-phosphate isomerase-like protein (cupin superfamily)